MKELTLSQIAAWCGADVPKGCGETRITGVESDSRAIAPGNLFIALKGERVDGHCFIPDVFEKGALAVLSEAALDHPAGPYILVDSTTEARASGEKTEETDSEADNKNDIDNI